MESTYLKEPEPCRLMKAEFINFYAHFHQQVEILYCAKGRQQILIDGISYELQAGDVAVIFPNQRHHYEPSQKSSGKELYLLLFEPSDTEEFYEDWINKRPKMPVLKRDQLPQFFEDLWQQFYEVYEKQHKIPLFRAYSSLLAAHMLTVMELKSVDVDGEQDDIQTVLNYVNRHYKEKITLDSTAKALGFSTTGLSRVFSKQVGCNFLTYVNTQRVTYAKRLLKTSRLPIDEVGARAGFQSRRSFYRNFQEMCGETPSDYREKKLKEKHKM